MMLIFTGGKKRSSDEVERNGRSKGGSESPVLFLHCVHDCWDLGSCGFLRRLRADAASIEFLFKVYGNRAVL